MYIITISFDNNVRWYLKWPPEWSSFSPHPPHWCPGQSLWPMHCHLFGHLQKLSSKICQTVQTHALRYRWGRSKYLRCSHIWNKVPLLNNYRCHDPLFTGFKSGFGITKKLKIWLLTQIQGRNHNTSIMNVSGQYQVLCQQAHWTGCLGPPTRTSDSCMNWVAMAAQVPTEMGISWTKGLLSCILVVIFLNYLPEGRPGTVWLLPWRTFRFTGMMSMLPFVAISSCFVPEHFTTFGVILWT